MQQPPLVIHFMQHSALTSVFIGLSVTSYTGRRRENAEQGKEGKGRKEIISTACTSKEGEKKEGGWSRKEQQTILERGDGFHLRRAVHTGRDRHQPAHTPGGKTASHPGPRQQEEKKKRKEGSRPWGADEFLARKGKKQREAKKEGWQRKKEGAAHQYLPDFLQREGIFQRGTGHYRGRGEDSTIL